MELHRVVVLDRRGEGLVEANLGARERPFGIAASMLHGLEVEGLEGTPRVGRPVTVDHDGRGALVVGEAHEASGVSRGLERLGHRCTDVLLTDIRLPGTVDG